MVSELSKKLSSKNKLDDVLRAAIAHIQVQLVREKKKLADANLDMVRGLYLKSAMPSKSLLDRKKVLAEEIKGILKMNLAQVVRSGNGTCNTHLRYTLTPLPTSYLYHDHTKKLCSLFFIGFTFFFLSYPTLFCFLPISSMSHLTLH